MVPPLLKLEFIAGPRAGDSLGFKPGSNVRVGRIVRGNEIAIKDAGISSKHLKIVSDSENWIIHDLGSSNGTTLNSESIDPEEPVNLSHGDVIKLGEYTSIVVNFVNDVQAPQEQKLPPRPRRNNKSVAVSDPIETEQEKPKRRGRSSKQEENEVPVRTRASRKRTLDEIADKEEELEVKVAKKVNSRVGRPRKNAKEEVPEEKEGNFKVPEGKNNESVKELSSKIKVEVEDSPKEVKILEVKSRKRATRSKQIKNVNSEDTVIEEIVEKRTSRATRSKKTEIGGDSFLELEMVLKKSRAKRKKPEQVMSKSVVKMEDRNDDAGEEALKDSHVGEDKENEVQGGCSERIEDRCDKEDEREEQVEIELRTKSSIGEDDMNCTVRVDGETENLQDVEKENENEVQGDCSERIEDTCDKEDEREVNRSKSVEQAEIELRKKSIVGEDDLNCPVIADIDTERQSEEECREDKVEEAEIAALDDQGKVEEGSSSKNVEVDLEKMTLDDWFDYMEVQLPKQIIEETGKMIEGMRSKALRVHKYIAEQKAKGL